MNKIENEIKQAMEKCKDLKKFIKLAKRFKRKIGNMPFLIYDSYIVLEPKWEDLSRARKIAKEVLGSWNDRLNSISNPYDDVVMIRYVSEKHPLVRIWAQTTIEETPKEFLKSGCKWETENKIVHRFVCPEGK